MGVDQTVAHKVSHRQKWMDRLKQRKGLSAAAEPAACEDNAPSPAALFCPILALQEEYKQRIAAVDESAALQVSPATDTNLLGRQKPPRIPSQASARGSAVEPQARAQTATAPQAGVQSGVEARTSIECGTGEGDSHVPEQNEADLKLHGSESVCPVVQQDEVNEYIFTACASGVVHQWAQDKQTQCDRFEVCMDALTDIHFWSLCIVQLRV